MGLEQLWSAFTTSLPSLKDAWPTMIGLIIVALAAGFAGGRFMFRERLEAAKDQIGSLQERIKLRDDQLNSLQQRVATAPPEQLNDLVSELRDRLRALEPYGLGKERAAAMLAILRQNPGIVLISLDISAWDALNLFEQLCGLFGEAKWTVTPLRGVFGFVDPPDCGVTLMKHPGSNEAVLTSLREAFNAAHLDFQERDLSGSQTGLTVPQIAISSRDRNYVPAARWT